MNALNEVVAKHKANMIYIYKKYGSWGYPYTEYTQIKKSTREWKGWNIKISIYYFDGETMGWNKVLGI